MAVIQGRENRGGACPYASDRASPPEEGNWHLPERKQGKYENAPSNGPPPLDTDGHQITDRDDITQREECLLDIETYSDVDLPKCGVYRYAASRAFRLLILKYCYGDGPIKGVYPAEGERLPPELLDALFDGRTVFVAHNASFERVCLSYYLRREYPGKYLKDGEFLDPDNWYCTMVESAEAGLPLSLENAAAALKTGEQKDRRGKELIRYFSVPCKPTGANGGRTRNLPEDAPDKWETFKSYCTQDVATERDIHRALRHLRLTPSEWRLYKMSERINDRGWLTDQTFVRQAIACDLLHSEAMVARAYQITGLENPNSVSQLKGWLKECGMEIDSLSKKAVAKAVEELDAGGCDEEVLEMLKLRQKMAKSSVKKYEACERAVCEDGRARGLFMFYGANHTGRWSGRNIMVHNLPQNHIEPLDVAREMVRDGYFEGLEYCFENTPQVLSELIRTAFIPKPGCRFIVADFSAIEARGLSWLAGEEWRMEVFRTHGKIYEATASNMFHVPIGEITKTSPLRQRGKQAELGCGYGGSVGALINMGALDNGIKESELQGIIDSWRKANPKIVTLWYDVDAAVRKVVKTGEPQRVGKLLFATANGRMFAKLPSGRKIAYVHPRLEMNKWGRESMTYYGVGLSNKWEKLETYGAKIVENCTQGMCRDILAEAMLRVEKAGFHIVAHVHDEMILEVPVGKSSVEEICRLMAVNPEWCPDLPLKADGYECQFYQKS